jgi:hypothetical protein
MKARRAFDAIHTELTDDPTKSVCESFFDEQAFGNFWLTYVRDGQRFSIVNDRGQVILNSGTADRPLLRILISDLYSADETTVLDAIA